MGTYWILLLLSGVTITSTANVSVEDDRPRTRRRLAPHENIHRYLSDQNARGVLNPKFVLASYATADDGVTEFEYDVDVVQATASINSRTTYSRYGGPSLVIPKEVLETKYLVQDKQFGGEETEKDSTFVAEEVSSSHTVNTPNTAFALVAVQNENVVTGITKKAGHKPRNILLEPDSNHMVAQESDEFIPPKEFRCLVDSSLERRLDEDPGHSHSHSHGHNHHHDNDVHDPFSGDVESMIEGLMSNQHRRRTVGFSSTAPSFQVDLYLEIDAAFVALHDNNETNALKYLNAVVTAASSILQYEVDTRLNVKHVDLNENYISADDAFGALDIMRDKYGASEWHHEGIDLHHAILGNQMGGGVAYIGALCSSRYGFGISPNMRGTFGHLDQRTVWDLSVFAHEIGHSLGAFHTFDRRMFKPPVDRCYIRSNDDSTCPSDAQLEDSGTLMSYCDSCPGATSRSLSYSYGGQFIGGDPANPASWRNDPFLTGTYSKNPKRVSMEIYQSISSKTCLEATWSCESDEDCADARSCTIDSCNSLSGRCERQSKENCCGNGEEKYSVSIVENQRKGTDQNLLGVCEAGESFSGCREDCGPMALETRRCDRCNAKRGRGSGIMFDVQSHSSETVLVNHVALRHIYTSQSTVSVYTAPGSYSDKSTSRQEWSLVATRVISVQEKKGAHRTITFDSPVAINALSSRAFYIATSSGRLISGHEDEAKAAFARDDNLEIKSPARIVGVHLFGGGQSGSYDGGLNYSILALAPS